MSNMTNGKKTYNVSQVTQKAKKMQAYLSTTYLSNQYIIYTHEDSYYLISASNTITCTPIESLERIFNVRFIAVSDALITLSTARELKKRYPSLDIDNIKIEALFRDNVIQHD